ncbi:hypothetical protein [Actinomyces sp.]|uniref:hypothetical protein n=1 Tax=Actinomyces sp. TaxID=29317 RepID=UPI0026DAA0E1|nr:hypothetical protein [Actinomyces sp.]MDO4899111.1 hypothetical protein [Actinomyces sp.]
MSSAEGEFSLSDISQWHGTPLSAVTNKQDDSNNIVQLGSAELLTTDVRIAGEFLSRQPATQLQVDVYDYRDLLIPQD